MRKRSTPVRHLNSANSPHLRHNGNLSSADNSSVSTSPPLIARRPHIVPRMRDLSPSSRSQEVEEYYKSYDVMTGVRIAATLGGLITLFALFLFYKSKCKSYKDVVANVDDIGDPDYFRCGSIISRHSHYAIFDDLAFDLSQCSIDKDLRRTSYEEAQQASSSTGRREFPRDFSRTSSLSSSSIRSTSSSEEIQFFSAKSSSPNFQGCVTSPEDGVTDSQCSSSQDVRPDLIINKRHLWVQYKVPSGIKTEDV